ncbi:MAG: hypothetical protein ACFFCL_06545 [Promethearchaeota archaeon]
MICKKLRIKDVIKEDFGRGIARIDPEILSEVNLNTGDIVSIFTKTSKKSTGAYVFPSDLKDKGTRIVRIDASLRRNLGVSINDIVKIKKTKIKLAQQVSFAGHRTGVILKNTDILAEKLKNRLVSNGDIFSFRNGNKKVDLIVVDHTPQTDVVKINEDTAIYSQETI